MADCTVGDTASHNHTAPRPSSACSCSPPGPILPAPSSISFQCGDNGPRRDVLWGTWGHLLRKAPPRIAAISPRSCLSRARRVCMAWRGGWVAFQGFQLGPDGSQTRDSGRCVLRHRPPAARPPGRKASAAPSAALANDGGRLPGRVHRPAWSAQPRCCWEILTELRALSRGFQKQLQFKEHQRHVDGVAAQPLRAEEKGDRGLELRREEEHLEVEEGLLVHREVGLAWGAGDTATQRGFLLAAWPQAEAPDLVPRPLHLARQLARRGHAVKPKLLAPGGRETEFGTLKQSRRGCSSPLS